MDCNAWEDSEDSDETEETEETEEELDVIEELKELDPTSPCGLCGARELEDAAALELAVAVQVLGWPVHRKFCSSMQEAEHPSPSFALPSSQASLSWILPLPQSLAFSGEHWLGSVSL